MVTLARKTKREQIDRLLFEDLADTGNISAPIEVFSTTLVVGRQYEVLYEGRYNPNSDNTVGINITFNYNLTTKTTDYQTRRLTTFTGTSFMGMKHVFTATDADFSINIDTQAVTAATPRIVRHTVTIREINTAEIVADFSI